MAPQQRTLRILFACSAGGHLAQLLRLEPWYRDHEVRWMTFDLPDAISLLPPDVGRLGVPPDDAKPEEPHPQRRLATKEIAAHTP